ncbi:hypothetical protein JHK87_018442 [Glycine soja]|nr:hypothetical protein JHK87_018442 [Glycine soja]
MAAATATPSDEQVHKVALKVLVDKEKNKVLFAEARKDFVDALFERVSEDTDKQRNATASKKPYGILLPAAGIAQSIFSARAGNALERTVGAF